MDVNVLYAALAFVIVIVTPAAFFIGSKRGQKREQTKRENARETAEQMSKRIISDAERDADSAKKSAVLAGKEEVIKLRESFDGEVRKRRQELEGDEKRHQEREIALDRKVDVLESRDKEVTRRSGDV